MQNILPLIARCLLSLIFLATGIHNAMHWQDTGAALASKGIAFADFFAGVSIVFLIAGSIFLILGFRSKVAALLLLIFLVPTTILFHLNLNDFGQVVNFLKNAGLAAGLLFIMAYGPGGLSMDARSQKQ